MRPDQIIFRALLLSCVLAAAGCGLKGPLRLPDKATNIETRSSTTPRPKDEAEDAPKKMPSTPDPAAPPAATTAPVKPATK